MKKEKINQNMNALLWQLLHRSHATVAKVRQKELEKYDATIRQAGVLRIVVRVGKSVTPTEIAKQLFLESNTITEQLNRMEADGLVKRVKDLDRKNLVRIAITKKGYSLFLKIEEQESIDKIMSVLTEEEKLELWSILAKIRGRALKELGLESTDLYPPADPADL